MSTKLQQKIIKLLRLAADREGSPEGDTARRLAATIMDTHGFTIDPDEIEFGEAQKVAQVLIAEGTERQWWQEMLLVTLCDVYGGETVPMSNEKYWYLYIVVEPDDEVDIPRLRQHFEYLCKSVHDLVSTSSSEFMRAHAQDREQAVSSFRIGAVFRISQLLYKDSTGEEPDLEHMPFMVRALSEATQNDAVSSAVVHVSPTTKSPTTSTTVVEIAPDWYWFDCGWRNATKFIQHVYEEG